MGASAQSRRTRLICTLVLLFTHGGEVWAQTPGWSTPNASGVGPSERSRPAVAALGDDIYLFGGIFDDVSSGEFAFLQDLYRFDTHSGQWDELAPEGPLPLPRGFAGYAAVPSRQGFAVFGGGQFEADLSVTIFGDLWLYTAEDNRWTQIIADNAGPPPRFDPKVWVSRGTLYVFGGLGDDFSVHNDLWAYEFRTNRWQLMTPDGDPSAPPARANATGPDRAQAGKLLFYGGEGGADTGFQVFDDVWQFDLELSVWQDISPAPEYQLEPPRNHTAAVWLHGALYLYGGDIAGGTVGCGALFPQNAVDELWRFDVQARAWELVDDPNGAPPPIKRHVAAVSGGAMYLFSGYDFAVTGSEPEPCQVWNLNVYAYRPAGQCSAR